MSAVKPTESIEFASADVVDGVSGVNNSTEPPAARKTGGWLRLEFPPRQWFNWLARYTFEYIRYLLASIESHATDTGSVTNGNQRVVIASTTSQSIGLDSAVIVSVGGVASGDRSLVAGSAAGQATGDRSAVIASETSIASGIDSVVMGSDTCDASGDHSAVIGSNGSDAIGDESAVVGSLSSDATGSESVVTSSTNCDADGAMSNINASTGSDIEVSGINSQMNASNNCNISGSRAKVDASVNSNAEADSSQISTSNGCHTIGSDLYKEIDTSLDSVNDALRSQIANSENCTILLAEASEIRDSELSSNEGDNALLVASLRTKNPNNNVVVGGYSATDLTVPAAVIVVAADPAVPPRSMITTPGSLYTGRPQGTASPLYDIEIDSPTTFRWRKTTDLETTSWTLLVAITGAAQILDEGVSVTFSTAIGWIAGTWTITIDDTEYTSNRQWELDSVAGDLNYTGALNNGPFADYAEFFENAEIGVVPFGTIVTVDGSKVRKCNAGDSITGVISSQPAICSGDSPFTWNKRYLRGEFGELLYDSIPDPDYEGDGDAPLINIRRENPDYDPSIPNIPRSERPDEWSRVGLLGQIHTRIGEDVNDGDCVAADGSKSEDPTRIKCMEITREFDADKGYAVAICLVR